MRKILKNAMLALSALILVVGLQFQAQSAATAGIKIVSKSSSTATRVVVAQSVSKPAASGNDTWSPVPGYTYPGVQIIGGWVDLEETTPWPITGSAAIAGQLAGSEAPIRYHAVNLSPCAVSFVCTTFTPTMLGPTYNSLGEEYISPWVAKDVKCWVQGVTDSAAVRYWIETLK